MNTVKHNKLIAVCEEFQNNDSNGSYQDIPQLVIDDDMTYNESIQYLLSVIDRWCDDAIDVLTGSLDIDTRLYYEYLRQQVKDVLND